MADIRPVVNIPPGRFISGSLTKKRTSDNRNQPIPEEDQRFEIGIAFRKDAPSGNQFWAEMIGGAKQCYAANPQVGPIIDAWMTNGFQGFSMKMSDGDKPNLQGKINENSVGCWVIWISTKFPFNCIDGQGLQIDPAVIERGYFVDAQINLAPNNNPIGDRIGVYLNPQAIRFIAVGEIIRGGPDLAAIAASMPQVPVALPPGAQPIGTAPPMGAPIPQQQQQQQQYAPAPVQQQQQQYAPAPAPVPGVPPNQQPGQAVTPAPGNGYGGAPAGTQPAPVGQQGQPIASPSNPNPQYAQIMSPPVPGVPQ